MGDLFWFHIAKMWNEKLVAEDDTWTIHIQIQSHIDSLLLRTAQTGNNCSLRFNNQEGF